MSRLIALGLGSNLGDREGILRRALDVLREHLGPLRIAPLYRTAPISTVEQPDFYNTVALATPEELPSPEAVLALAQRLEHEAGRRRGLLRDAPRTLDIDLLLCGTARLDRPDLTVPHPRLRERRFVLAPLCDLEPDLALPPDGARVVECLAALGGAQEAERIAWTSPG